MATLPPSRSPTGTGRGAGGTPEILRSLLNLGAQGGPCKLQQSLPLPPQPSFLVNGQTEPQKQQNPVITQPVAT